MKKNNKSIKNFEKKQISKEERIKVKGGTSGVIEDNDLQFQKDLGWKGS